MAKNYYQIFLLTVVFLLVQGCHMTTRREYGTSTNRTVIVLDDSDALIRYCEDGPVRAEQQITEEGLEFFTECIEPVVHSISRRVHDMSIPWGRVRLYVNSSNTEVISWIYDEYDTRKEKKIKIELIMYLPLSYYQDGRVYEIFKACSTELASKGGIALGDYVFLDTRKGIDNLHILDGEI